MAGRIGIVTVLYNSDDVLPGFFESLAKQKNVSYRLYVIDNSQTDSGCQISRDLAAQYEIDALIHFNNENVGVAKGNNQGIEMALKDECQYVLLSNNDIEFYDPLLISGLLSALCGQDVHAVVPKILYFQDKNRIWCAGGRFSLYSATTPHIGDGHLDGPKYDVDAVIEYSPTCFMLLKADIFKDVGLMDERYFVYYDDTDFMWRMNARMKRIFYHAAARVWHKVSFSTGGGESIFSLYYGYRNRIFFIRKNYSIFYKIISLIYIAMTLVPKAYKFNKEQRSSVLKGVRSGFSIEI